jgi:integrase
MRHTGHIRQRSPGSYELRYSLGTDPATGKRKTITTTVRGTRKEAVRELRRLQHTIDTGEHVDPSRMTVRDWLKTWLTAVRAEVSPKTHERYSELIQHFLAPALGNVPVQKLAPSHIQAAYNELATGKRRDGRPGGLSPRTRRQIHAVLCSALTRAVEQQLITHNPAEAFRRRLPKVERREMTTLTTEECGRLLEAVRHQRLYWPVLLALASGMRRGEILALRWRNVDLDSGTVRVVESLEQTREGLRFKPPKTDRSRVVALPAAVTEELRRLKREQAEELLRLGVRQTGSTLVCGRADSEPLQPRSLTHVFAVSMQRLKNFPQIRFHDLRHTHATQLLSAGIHPKIAQERLGHSTITTTFDLYSHVTATMQEEAATKLDSVFRSAISTRPVEAS